MPLRDCSHLSPVAVQAKYAAFRQRFPAAEERGVGLCSSQRCTSPWLFAAGLSPDEAQTDRENWCGCLQEVALDAPTDGARLGWKG